MSYTPGGAVADLLGARVSGGAQSIPNNTNTNWTGLVVDWDPDGIWDAVAQQYVVVVAGKYLVNISTSWVSSAVGRRHHTASQVMDLSPADTVAVRAFQTSGGALNSSSRRFAVHRLKT